MKIGELFLTILAGAIAVVFMTGSMESVVSVMVQVFVFFCCMVMIVSAVILLLSEAKKGRKGNGL